MADVRQYFKHSLEQGVGYHAALAAAKSQLVRQLPQEVKQAGVQQLTEVLQRAASKQLPQG